MHGFTLFVRFIGEKEWNTVIMLKTDQKIEILVNKGGQKTRMKPDF